MDPIRRLHRPVLRRPRALVAFEGWNDASDAASGAAAYVIGQYDAEPFAVLEPEEFFDFQTHRPEVEVDDGGTRSLTWPSTRFFAVNLPDRDHDLVVVLGEEPNLRWKTFCRHIAEVFAENAVEEAVLLGAFICQVPHTVPVPVVGVATEPALVKSLGLLRSRYEGPTGIVGVLLEAMREEGIPTVSLWGAVPHYLSANPNPKAMLALLDKAATILDVPVDATELSQVAGEFESRVDAAVEQSEDLGQYIARLEKEAETEDLFGSQLNEGDAGQLVQEVEEFLRERPS